MSAITVNRAGHIYVNGEPSGHVDADGSVVVEGDRLGRVERVETVGPRGGAVVEWLAHSPYMHVSPAYRTRSAAVGAVMEAWNVEPSTESVECAACVECRTAPTDAPDGPYARPDGSVVRVPSVNVSYEWHVPGWAWGVRASAMAPGEYTERGDVDPVAEAEGVVTRVLGDGHGVTFCSDGGTVDGYGSDGDHVVTVECVPYVWTPCGPCVCSVEAPEGATDAPDPVTGVTEAERVRYGSVMAARGARMSHTVTSVENVRGTWNVRATASDGAPEHFMVVPSWGDVRWYARGGECVLPLPVGVTFPDTRTGAVEAVITVMSGPVQWADDAAPYRPTPVTEPTPADIAHAAYRTPPAVVPVWGRSSVITDPMTDAASVTITRGAVSIVVSPWSDAPGSGWGVWVDATGVDPYAGVKVTTDDVVDVVAGYLPVEGTEADDTEAPVRAHVVEWRAGDYVEVSVGGEHHVYTWTDDRGVVRDYHVTMNGHADYGDFTTDPVAWVRAYYAAEDVTVEGPEDDDALPESNGAPLGAVARAALDALSGETDVHWTPTESGTGDVSAVVWECGNGGNRNTYRVGVFMSDAGTVFNGMDGAGDCEHMVTDDADAAVSFIRAHLELEPAPECVVCGGAVDYCPGHGADNYAAYVWAAHDADYHGECRASCRTEGARGVLIVSREYDPDTDVYDGDVDYAETRADWYPDVSVLDAVDLLRGEHLTTSADAHGPDVWTEGAARGEHVNYRTGIVTETEAYMRGYTDAECAVIAALATGEPWECGGVTVTGVGFRVWDVGADEVDADAVPWFHREDYPDADADDAARFIPLSDGDVLPLSDVMALRHTFTPGAEVMEPDNVHSVLHGASTDSVWSGYGVIHDDGDDTWSVVRMTW